MKATAAWGNGVTLWDALFVYGKPDTVARFRAAMKKPAMPGIFAGLTGLFDPKADWEANQAIMSETQELLNERVDLEKRLEADVVMQLQTGALTGLAFEEPRKLNSAPVAIPRSAWLGRIDWRKSSLSHEGLSFVAVRIAEPEKINLPAPSPQGRPSRRPEIISAFQQLDAEGAIDRTQSLASHFAAIRLRAKEVSRNSADKGLGDKALYATLSAIYVRQI